MREGGFEEPQINSQGPIPKGTRAFFEEAPVTICVLSSVFFGRWQLGFICLWHMYAERHCSGVAFKVSPSAFRLVGSACIAGLSATQTASLDQTTRVPPRIY
jgi:hypothetical protein